MNTINIIQNISRLSIDIANHEIKRDDDLKRSLNELLGKEPRPQHIARLINTMRNQSF